MKVFLTGGTGFIGSNLLKALIRAGHQVIALRRDEFPSSGFSHQHLQWRIGKLTDDWSADLLECSGFIHLAAYGVTGSFDCWDNAFNVNVIDSLRILRQAAAFGVRRFVIFGSCFEYGRAGDQYSEIPSSAPLIPTTAYAASKASASMAAVALAAEYNLELVVLRPFHVFGPGEIESRFWPSLCKAASLGLDFPMTQGEQVRDFQPVDQTCLQTLDWLGNPLNPGQPIVANLGTGRPKTLLEFAKEEWERLGATGSLLPGAFPYRKNEVMRYVPMLS